MPTRDDPVRGAGSSSGVLSSGAQRAAGRRSRVGTGGGARRATSPTQRQTQRRAAGPIVAGPAERASSRRESRTTGEPKRARAARRPRALRGQETRMARPEGRCDGARFAGRRAAFPAGAASPVAASPRVSAPTVRATCSGVPAPATSRRSARPPELPTSAPRRPHRRRRATRRLGRGTHAAIARQHSARRAVSDSGKDSGAGRGRCSGHPTGPWFESERRPGPGERSRSRSGRGVRGTAPIEIESGPRHAPLHADGPLGGVREHRALQGEGASGTPSPRPPTGERGAPGGTGGASVRGIRGIRGIRG